MTDLPRHTTYSLFFDLFVLGQRSRELLAGGDGRRRPLTPEEYATYSVVFEDEAVSPTAMAAQLSMPLTTVVDAIRTMERRGHLRRMPNPARRPLVPGRPHGRGPRAHAEANARFEVGYQAFVAELPDGEATAQREVAKLLGAAERALRTTAPVGAFPGSVEGARRRPAQESGEGRALHSASARRPITSRSPDRRRPVRRSSLLLLAVPALVLGSSDPLRARPVPVRCARVCDGSTDSLGNGGFETPGVAPGTFVQFPAAAVPPWQTTDGAGLIEIWGTGFLGVPADEGDATSPSSMPPAPARSTRTSSRRRARR